MQQDITSAEDEYWMHRALALATAAADRGEVPVGAVLINHNGLLAESGNSPISLNDPTAHAEILVLRQGGQKLCNYRLPATTLYVTLEPCLMCMGAIIHARISRLVFGATDPKTGAVGSLYNIADDGRLNHRLEVTSGVLAMESSQLLRLFFRSRRREKNVK